MKTSILLGASECTLETQKTTDIRYEKHVVSIQAPGGNLPHVNGRKMVRGFTLTTPVVEQLAIELPNRHWTAMLSYLTALPLQERLLARERLLLRGCQGHSFLFPVDSESALSQVERTLEGKGEKPVLIRHEDSEELFVAIFGEPLSQSLSQPEFFEVLTHLAAGNSQLKLKVSILIFILNAIWELPADEVVPLLLNQGESPLFHPLSPEEKLFLLRLYEGWPIVYLFASFL